MKVCTRCKVEQNLSEFRKNKNNKDGLHLWCRTCTRDYYHTNKEKMDARTKKWVSENPDRFRQIQRESSRGITDAEYNQMLSDQGGLCLICETKMETPHLDHDHRCCPGVRICGKCIRGILCPTCNRGLGFFKDDVHLLKKAIDYLEKSVL